MYATSTSSLTTGTLPVVAGGTGVASLTTGYIPFGAGTSNLASTSNLTYSTTTNTLTAPYFNATGAVTANVAYGAFNNGNLGYSDTGIFGSFVTSQNSYGQWILQNSSSGNAASADYVVSNNLGANNAYYGDFGINSSTFAGAGSFSLPNAVYTYSSNGDMVVGTITGNNFRVVTNNSNTDAITVNITNSVAFNGSYGTSGFLLQSGASTAPPTWIAPANITGCCNQHFNIY